MAWLRVGPTCILALAAAWLVAVTAAFAFLGAHDSTPGPSGPTSHRLSDESPFRFGPGRTNLVAAIHPRCPCSWPTVELLERLEHRRPIDLGIHVLVYRPVDAPEHWQRTDLVRRLESLPGCRSIVDFEGTEARRLGLQTSGHVLVYRRDGDLAFSGGLTDSRGHGGEGAAWTALLGALSRPDGVVRTPVFGCPLFDLDCPAGEGADSCRTPTRTSPNRR